MRKFKYIYSVLLCALFVLLAIPYSFADTGDIVSTDAFGLKLYVDDVEYDVSDILRFVKGNDRIYYLEPVDQSSSYHVLTTLNNVYLHRLLEDKIDEVEYDLVTDQSIRLELDIDSLVNYHFTFRGAQSSYYTDLGYTGIIEKSNLNVLSSPYSIDFSGSYVANDEAYVMDVDIKVDDALSGTYTEPGGTSPAIVLGVEMVEMSITYNVDDAEYITDDNITYGTLAAQPISPTKTGYTFIGWYTGDDKLFNFSSMIVTEDLVLDAKFVEDTVSTYTVTFNSNGGSAIDDQIVPEDTAVVLDIDPTRTGYSFAGWYTDNILLVAYDPETMLITEDIALYAKWVESVSVPIDVENNAQTWIITLSSITVLLAAVLVYVIVKKR